MEYKRYMIERIDPELWQKFKLLCVMERVSMHGKLKKMIEEEVERARRRYAMK